MTQPQQSQSTPEPTPAWKADFPYKQEEAMRVSRREFAKYLCLFSGCLAAGSGILAIKAAVSPAPDKAKTQGEHLVCASADVPVGGMKTFALPDAPGTPCLLLRLGADKWRAFAQKCTHLSCAVYYDAEQNIIACPCHNGAFNPDTGAALKGPPPRPLPRLAVVVRNEKIYVTGAA